MFLLVCILIELGIFYLCIKIDWHRREKYGPTQKEIYNQTMRELRHDVQENIWKGAVRLRGEHQRLEEQQQRNAELRQQYPELYSNRSPLQALDYWQDVGKKNGIIK